MDKIKKLLGPVLKHQFWILAGVIGLLSVAVFAMTAMNLSKQTTERITAIGSKYTEVQNVSGKVSTHPNEESHKRMQVILNSIEKDVEKAWKMQYEYQMPVLTWPAEAFRNKETVAIFQGLRPVEKYVPFPVEGLSKELASITQIDRNVYRDYIGPTFANISKIIGTEWKADITKVQGRRAPGMGMGMGMDMAGGAGDIAGMAGYDPTMAAGDMYSSDPYGSPGQGRVSKDVVIWSQQSQQNLLNQMVPWYSPSSAPSILDIYYTQEDIWLLTNVMQIIKATNGEARENFQAIVKEIEFIRLGKSANRDAGTITSVAMRSASGMGDDSSSMDAMGGGAMDDYSSMGMGDDGSGMPMEPVEVDPANDRYISFAPDTFFQTRSGEEIRESIKNVNPANAVDAVAKRIPIRIRVKMDPSKVHRLITACGNARLMLEVFQVRMNTTAAAEGGGPGGGMYGGMGGAYDGGMGGMDPYAGDPTMGMGGDMAMGGYPGGMDAYAGGDPYAGGGMSALPPPKPQKKEIPVEIFGLIYLYNPYDKESLGTVAEDPVEAESESADTGEPTAPEAEAAPANSEITPENPQQPAEEASPANELPAEETHPAPQPEPAQPEPAQPEPAQPEAAQPEPPQPESQPPQPGTDEAQNPPLGEGRSNGPGGGT